MKDLKVSSLVIEPEDDSDAFGIITRKDVVEGLIEDEIGGSVLRVQDTMTKPAITVHETLSIYNCQQLMRMVGVRRLLVVDGSSLKGIVSNSDIFRILTEKI